MESSNLCCVAAGKRRHGARGHGGSCGCSQLGPALPVSQRCCHRHHHHPGAGSAPAAPRPSPMVSVGCALTPCPVPVSSRFLLLFFFSFSFFFFFFFFFPTPPRGTHGEEEAQFPIVGIFLCIVLLGKTQRSPANKRAFIHRPQSKGTQGKCQHHAGLCTPCCRQRAPQCCSP